MVTQVLTLTKQMELGIRAFDFRMIADPKSKKSEEKIRFTHGHVYQDAFFPDALTDALNFIHGYMVLIFEWFTIFDLIFFSFQNHDLRNKTQPNS